MPNSSESLTSDSSIISSRQVKQEKGNGRWGWRRLLRPAIRPGRARRILYESTSSIASYECTSRAGHVPRLFISRRETEIVQMFGTAQSMVTRNQMEFDWETRGRARAVARRTHCSRSENHCILETVEDRRVHRPESIEACLPIGFAFLDPFPREWPILVSGLVVPGHSAGGLPRLCAVLVKLTRARHPSY